MKTKNKFQLVKSHGVVLLCAACLLMISCEQKEPQGNSSESAEEEKSQPTVYCSPQAIKAPFGGGEYSVLLTAPSAWTATCNRDWVELDTKSGQGTAYIEIEVEKGGLDSTNILFSTGAETAMLKIVRGTPLVESGKENGHGYVDLGLSVKWATCNIGASSPEKYGNYYAWGETTTKSNYSYKNYKFDKGSLGQGGSWNSYYTKYCTESNYGKVDNKTVLESSDDAAHVNWGGKWRMPTKEEFEELVNNCTYFAISHNGVEGMIFISKKAPGNSIFFPHGGGYSEDKLCSKDEHGYYWSSSLYEYRKDVYAEAMRVSGYSYYSITSFNRAKGYSIRPVCR